MQEAQAMLEKGCRTLREARAKQHFVKPSRQYCGAPHRPKPTPFVIQEGPSGQRSKRLHSLLWWKPPRRGLSPETEELQCGDSNQREAPFVCLAEQVAADGPAANKILTSQAMEQGKAVIDGGATRTLGSVRAVETRP